MLAVGLFIALWVVLGVGVFAVAHRARSGERPPPSPAERRRRGIATGWLVAVIYIGFGVVIPGAFLIGNHANASGQVGGIKLTSAEKQGRELFGHNCAFCHTLAAANAVGQVGPNLDSIRPSEQLVLHTIENGCLQSPPSNDSAQTCLGFGTMPAGVLQGQQARDVAQFVATVAGRE